MKTIAKERSFADFTKRLLAQSELEDVLAIAMDIVIDITGAERGLVILFDNFGDTIFQVARNFAKEDLQQPQFEVSRTIIEIVQKEKTSRCIRNALEEPRLSKSNSVFRLKILSVICVPLLRDNQLFGVIYLDNRTVRGIFAKNICKFVEEIAAVVSLSALRALEKKQLQDRVQTLEQELRAKYRFAEIIGQHPKMLEILKLVSQVASTDSSVLIVGETGTGKELIAQALHYNNRKRSGKDFVPVNCGAIPENLLESELFGHVRGAFTGAIRDNPGLFERADGGTLFLDEVSDMSPALQVKLLRILQTGEYNRVGSSEIRFCDVRIVAASGKDLKIQAEEGKFREDLYYRLNVIGLNLPTLRERNSDIPLLVDHFLKKFGDKYEKKGLTIPLETMSILMKYDYPGNIRELENIIQHAIVLAQGNIITRDYLPAHLIQLKTPKEISPDLSPFRESKRRLVEEFEHDYLIKCLRSTHGNISKAAQLAGIDGKNFHDKLEKYSIDVRLFKKKPS